MGEAVLSDFLTEILIPVAAIIGIAFSLIQWVLVSRVKLSPERQPPSSGNKNGGLSDYLIEEEEGFNDHNVVAKCAEIQNAISEGAFRRRLDLSLSDLELFSVSSCRSCLQCVWTGLKLQVPFFPFFWEPNRLIPKGFGHGRYGFLFV